MTENKVVVKPDPIQSNPKPAGGGGGNKKFAGYQQKKFEGEIPALSECVFDCQNASEAKNFNRYLETLATYVGRTYEHGGELRSCIMKIQPFSLQQPTDPGDSATRTEIKIWEIKIGEFIKKEGKLKAHLKNIFSVIWGQCTEIMKTKLTQLSVFNTLNADQDSIALLAEIKGLVFHFDTTDYAPMAMAKLDLKMYRFTQGRDVSDAKYHEQFTGLKEVIEHYGGKVGLHPNLIKDELESITGSPYNESIDYDEDDIEKARSDSRDKYLACLFLLSTDRIRYGSLVDGIENDHVKGLNTYPKTLQEAFALLTQTKATRRGRFIPAGSSFLQGEIKCWGCGTPGVILSECVNPECVKKWKAKQERQAAAKSLLQGEPTPPELEEGQQHLNWDAVPEFDLNQFQSFSMCQPTGKVNKVPAKYILLDSESTHCTFYSPEYLTDIREAEVPIMVSTNGGPMVCDQEGDLAGFGKVYFNPEGIANILSLAVVESQGWRVQYDSFNGGCFVVTNQQTGKVTKFNQMASGLYAHDVTHDPSGEQGFAFVETVKENRKLFTTREFLKAKQARELYRMIGTPSPADFSAAIKNNLIPNARVTAEDIKNAEFIFGKDLGSIQGKTTRRKPSTVVNDHIDLPPDILSAHHDLVLCADIFFVDKIPFLVTISRQLKFITGDRLPNREVRTIVSALLRVFSLYHKRGFKITVCNMDNEFEPLQNVMLSRTGGVPLNICAPDEHVPEVERAIRTIKERVRSIACTLPFVSLPDIIVVHLVLFTILWLNFFPPVGGVSRTLSPEAIVKGRSMDSRRHCRAPFGGYAQVHAVNPQHVNNALVSRTVGGIALGPTGNAQGTYKFMSLLTGRLIKARSFQVLPMPQDVVNKVNTIAKDKKTELVFGNRTGEVTIHDLDEDPDSDDDDDDYDDYESAREEESVAEEEQLQDDEDIMSIPPVETEGADLGVLDGTEVGATNNPPPPQPPGTPSIIYREPYFPEEAVEVHLDEDEEGIGEDNYGHDLPTPSSSSPEPEGINQSILEIANEFESQLDEPGLSTPSPIVRHQNENRHPEFRVEETHRTSPSDGRSDTEGVTDAPSPDKTTSSVSSENNPETSPTPYMTRTGREIRPRRFFMHEGFGALTKADGDPELWRPSIQASYGMRQKSKRDADFAYNFAVHYCMTQLSLKQGIRAWGDDAINAVKKEVQQMHDKKVYKPVKVGTLTRQEKLAALRSIIFLKQKRCGRIKARLCADGRPQRFLYEKTDAASPTVKTESVLLTAVQEADENRDVCVADIPGAFLNAYLKEVVHMRLEGVLADALIAVDPELYGPAAFKDKNGVTVIYVQLTRALYGCLKSSLQWYKQLTKVLIDEDFIPNPYDSCVVNKIIKGSQCTICWHVDDLKISHKDPKVVDEVLECLQSIYGELSVTRGKKHTYLGMDLDYSCPGMVCVSMIPYLKEIIDEFPEDLGERTAKTPATLRLFDINKNPEFLDPKKANVFHHVVAKLLWASLRARPDILLAVSFLTSRVKKPDVDDWGKLVRLLLYIKGTLELLLRLTAHDARVQKWWIDASFGTRDDFKSHTGGCMSLGDGAIISVSKKQKLNTKSSTEAELVGVDDVLPQVLWTRQFLIHQGWEINDSVVYQDNKSAILLETNGMASSSKRTRHINIRFFFIKDRVAAGEISVQYCPTEDMWGDYFTKPLQGNRFLQIRQIIMNEPGERSVLEGDLKLPEIIESDESCESDGNE